MTKTNFTNAISHPPGRPTKAKPVVPKKVLSPVMCFNILKTVYEFGMLNELSLYRLIAEQHSDCPAFDDFLRHLQDIVRDTLLACVQQSRHDLYHKSKNILPGTPGQNAYHLTALGEDYLQSRGMHLSFGMNPQYFAEGLACSDALLQLRSLLPDPAIIRGPAALVVWENRTAQVLLSPDGLLLQPVGGGKPEQAYLVMLQWGGNTSSFSKAFECYELLLQPIFGWDWGNWGLSKMPVLLFIDQDGSLTRYQEELAHRQKPNGRYAVLALADLWQGQLAIQSLNE